MDKITGGLNIPGLDVTLPMAYNVLPLTRLIEQFERLPGIGKRRPSGWPFYVLGLPQEKAQEFANAIPGRQGEDQAVRGLPEPDRRGALPHLPAALTGTAPSSAWWRTPGRHCL